MRNFDEHTITQAVLDRMAQAPNPRAKAISEAVVRHLHALVREVRPTQAEWEDAIGFLTRTGHLCSDVRQEFILLSDALGVSMLVDAINHPLPNGATETTVFGPFFVPTRPDAPNGACIASQASVAPLLIEGSVRRLDGTPLVGAKVDIWHADDEGFYDVQKDPSKLNGRACVRTNDDGCFHVVAAMPSAYPIPNDGTVGAMLQAQGRHAWRPAHVHFMIEAPGCETLVTHLFLAHSEYLDTDVVFGVKDSLIATLEHANPGVTQHGAQVAAAMPALRHDFVLAPARSTA